MDNLTEKDIARLASDPEGAKRLLDKLDAEDKLVDFIEDTWPVLEPGRPFVRGWAVEAVCDALEGVSYGHLDGRGLLINVPPGFMKSMTTDVFFPAWEWGPRRMPWLRYLSISYSEKLTIRDNKKCRGLIRSDAYQERWGDVFQISEDEDNKQKFATDRHGFKLATSVGGYVMGERGDRIVLDDPNNTAQITEANLDNALFFFTETLPSRVNDPDTAVFIVIMQRVHEKDIAGHILANDLDYEHLMIPMEFEPDRRCHLVIGDWRFVDPREEEGELAFPERFSKRSVEKLKKDLRSLGGEYAVAGQLQQRPTPRGGGMFHRDDWEIVDVAPEPASRPVRGWDLAGSKKKKSPRTASVRMYKAKDGRIVVTHAEKFQKGPGGVKQEIIDRAASDDEARRTVQDLPQDPAQAGLAQKKDLAAALMGRDFQFSPESGDKEYRARPWAAQVEAKNVVLLRGAWNNDFIEEHAHFPAGAYKDQVDAASRAYAGLSRKRDQMTPTAPQILESEGEE